MLTVILGLAGAITYGVADFLGGLASRTRRAIVVTAFAGSVGILPLLLFVPLLHARFSSTAIVWGVAAGIAGSVGVLLLYRALAIGPMSVLSPVTSVFAALVPVAVGLLTGTRLSPLALGAIVAAIAAVILVASSRNTSGVRLTGHGLLIAVIAGCGFGGLVLAYNGTDPDDGIAPLVVARVVQALVMWAGVLIIAVRARASSASGPLSDLPRRPRFWMTVIACGIFDAGANVFIQAGLHASDDPAALPVISVLNALYPIGTILLAAIVLRERLTWLQVTGLVLGFAASAVLALA